MTDRELIAEESRYLRLKQAVLEYDYWAAERAKRPSFSVELAEAIDASETALTSLVDAARSLLQGRTPEQEKTRSVEKVPE